MARDSTKGKKMAGTTIVLTDIVSRGDMALIFYETRFLLVPRGEVVWVDDSIVIEEESLQAAFDVTPDLPERVLVSAWRHKQIFLAGLEMNWAASVAQQVSGLSAHDILQAYQRVSQGAQDE